MKYVVQIFIVSYFTFAEASVLINVLDNVLEKDVSSLYMESVDTNDVNSCNAERCSISCLTLGFPDGRCKDDICECIYKLRHHDLRKTRYVTDCSPLECDQSCRRIGFPGGACVNGRCKCDII